MGIITFSKFENGKIVVRNCDKALAKDNVLFYFLYFFIEVSIEVDN